jgi:FkbM family methyltransferase
MNNSLLTSLLNYDNGFFIEAGANDGIDQSYTRWLDSKNWSGLLIEPNKLKLNEAKKRRPNCICENYALVSDTYKKNTILGDFNHTDRESSLTAMVMDYGHFVDDELIFQKKRRENNGIEVLATTLTNLLLKHNINNIDFLSLDVEGYELSVLNGLNFELHRPKYILLEVLANSPREDSILEFMIIKKYKNLGMVDHNRLFER